MKAAVVGGLVGLAVAFVFWLSAERTLATNPTSSAGGELIAFSTTLADGGQQVTIIDPRTRSMSVYHTDASTGEISLRSVRNVHWDLQLTEFNSNHPLPREVQGLIEQR